MGLHSISSSFNFLPSALVDPPIASVRDVIVAGNADNRMNLTVNGTVRSYFTVAPIIVLKKRDINGPNSVFFNSENITFADGGSVSGGAIMVNFGEAIAAGNLTVIDSDYINYGITRGERLTVEPGSVLYARTCDNMMNLTFFPDNRYYYRIHDRRTGVVTVNEFNLLNGAILVFDNDTAPFVTAAPYVSPCILH